MISMAGMKDKNEKSGRFLYDAYIKDRKARIGVVGLCYVNLPLHGSIPVTENLLKRYDCAVVITDHSMYDYAWLVKNGKLIVDTGNAAKSINSRKIIKA
jgi:UDP-N-acetyl-D-mannosaminuronate dehydrogenase